MTPMEDAASRFAEGMRRLQGRDMEGAVEAFGSAIAVFPQFEPAYRMRAEAYRSLGRQAEAGVDLDSVISITRGRLQEAEQSRGGSRAPAPSSAARGTGSSGPRGSPLSGVKLPSLSLPPVSTIILGTIIMTVVMLVVAVGLIILAGN